MNCLESSGPSHTKLDGLDQNMISELKAMKSMPPILQRALYPCCVIMGLPPNPDSIKALLGDFNILSKLRAFKSSDLT